MCGNVLRIIKIIDKLPKHTIKRKKQKQNIIAAKKKFRDRN